MAFSLLQIAAKRGEEDGNECDSDVCGLLEL